MLWRDMNGGLLRTAIRAAIRGDVPKVDDMFLLESLDEAGESRASDLA